MGGSSTGSPGTGISTVVTGEGTGIVGVSGIPGVWGGRDADGGVGKGVGLVGGEVGGEVGGTEGEVGGIEGEVGGTEGEVGGIEGEVGGTEGEVGGSDVCGGGEVGGSGAGDWVGDFGKSCSRNVPGIKAIGRSQVAVNVTPKPKSSMWLKEAYRRERIIKGRTNIVALDCTPTP